MNDSLSIVLPVCNAEATLPGQVARLLDVLPDLSPRLEIVLVDDASDDQTVDVARELAAEFPQLRLIRHRDRRGLPAAVRTGLQWARGRTVFVQEDPGALSTCQLRRLWSLRNDEQLVIARTLASPRALDEQLLERLAHWGRGLAQRVPAVLGDGGIHMMRREAALQLLADGSDDENGQGVTPVKTPTHARADAPHATARPRRDATFLRHLRNLAMGE